MKEIRKNLEEIHERLRKCKKEETRWEISKSIKIGEIVFIKILPMKNVLTTNLPRYEGPYLVVSRKGDCCYVSKD